MTESRLTCANCGHAAGPRFCGHCGQALHDRRSPLAWVVRELAEEWFSIDGRIFRLGFLLSIVAYLLVFLFMLTVYLARSLHRVYAQRWSITVVKTAALMLAYFPLLQPMVGAAVFLVLWWL